MTNLECIEYASKYSFKGLYEKGRADVMNDDNIVSQLLDMGYNKGRRYQTEKIFDELFELMEGPAENQCLLITYQALKDMYREYMEDII